MLIITPSNFPYEDAAAIRDMAFAKIYQMLGYQVFCICCNCKKRMGTVEGINWKSIYVPYKSKLQHIERFLKKSAVYHKEFKKYIDDIGIPDMIHYTGDEIRFFSFLVKYAESHGIMILHSSVEWYSACEFKTGIFSHVLLLSNIHNAVAVRKPVKVISISRFFDKYYTRKSIDSIRIPVIMDCSEDINIVRDNGKINIAYVGSPGKKDYLSNIAEAIVRLPDNIGDRIFFHIVGIDMKEFIKTVSISSKYEVIHSRVQAYGRLPHAEAIDVLRKADFSILVRPAEERYSKAGFPTKIVEALSNGVAVMCNLTSDLELYLEDLENAIILENESPEAIIQGITRISILSDEKIIKMRGRAKQTAMDFFDYRKYVTSVDRFIKGE